jgi:RNA polymerase sigma factor (sigma-70 family)
VEQLQPDQLTDRALVDRVLKGDQRAFGIIVQNTERLVVQILARMVPDAELQKDIAQDVYLKAYQSLSGFRHGAKLSTWIARIAFNSCVDELRKRKWLSPWPDEQENGDGHQQGAFHGHQGMTSNFAADEPLLSREKSAMLRTHLDALPPLYRTLITLYHQEELSYEEITVVTGLPLGTVKNYLFRARKTLKTSIMNIHKTEDL